MRSVRNLIVAIVLYVAAATQAQAVPWSIHDCYTDFNICAGMEPYCSDGRCFYEQWGTDACVWDEQAIGLAITRLVDCSSDVVYFRDQECYVERAPAWSCY